MNIEYLRLKDLTPHPRNPKRHDIGAVITSIEEFGFVSAIFMDEGSGYIVAGHGRLEALQEMVKLKKPLPDNIKTDEKGNWLVPVVRGITFKDDKHVEAYLVADNRLTELGGWDESVLVDLLQDLATVDLLNVTGYDGDDLDLMLSEFNPDFKPTTDIPDPLSVGTERTCPHCGKTYIDG